MVCRKKKAENFHRFALSTITFWDRKRKKSEKERSTQFGGGSINGPYVRGRGGINAKIGCTFETFNDLWGHTYLYEIFKYSLY